jgi:16S rRNA U1498 N3-methylase RsmE
MIARAEGEEDAVMLPNTETTEDLETPVPATYLSCSREELVELGIEAWHAGMERARVDGMRALREIERVTEAAEEACRQALETYIPLDAAKFCEAYTLAWSAGYYAQAKHV